MFFVPFTARVMLAAAVGVVSEVCVAAGTFAEAVGFERTCHRLVATVETFSGVY